MSRYGLRLQHSVNVCVLPQRVYFFSACSIVYELLVAKTVAKLTGSPMIWESVTIGVYVAALGVGIWLFEKAKSQEGDTNSLLVRTECVDYRIKLYVLDATILDRRDWLGFSGPVQPEYVHTIGRPLLSYFASQRF